MSDELRSEAESRTLVPVAGLRELLAALLVKKGVFAVEAEMAADRLIEADLRGEPVHGATWIDELLNNLDLGDIDPRAKLLTVSQTPAVALLDGSTGLGQIAVTRAMNLAIEKARELGVGVVVVRNSQPCGDPGTYVYAAADQSCIGFCTTSTDVACVAPPGETAPLTGEHPFAIGMPTGVDEVAIVSGRCIPGNTNGQPTLPAAFAAMWSGLVAGLMTSGLAGGKLPVNKKRRGSFAEASEHVCLVIDPEKFGGREHFLVQLHSVRDRLPKSSVWHGDLKGSEVPLDASTVALLETRATKAKLPIPWEQAG
ncbi:MAG: Ldh family oxidoreductase [Planctomycetaceae bacterium]|jgi:hypothetical protein|nr:Ldh family oxidoreductase [Planctomycetaceae bacterium]